VHLRPVLKELALDIERPVRPPVLVALGDPAFDEEPAAVVAASGVGGHRGPAETGPRFRPIPHSGDEVRSLAATFEEAFGEAFGEDAKVEVLTGDHASRRHLLRKLGQARCLHLATHG
jgi:hypothetical protein